MDFAIIVLDELFYESTILVKDLISHVGDVMEHRLILHLMQSKHDTQRQLELNHWQIIVSLLHKVQKYHKVDLTPISTECNCYKFTHTHHKVLLQRRPRVHDRDWGHSVESLQGDDLLGEVREAAVDCALLRTECTVRTLHLQRLSLHVSVPTTTLICRPLGCLSRSRRTSWCEPAGFAWSSTPGSKCQFAPWFSGGWCWTCSARSITKNKRQETYQPKRTFIWQVPTVHTTDHSKKQQLKKWCAKRVSDKKHFTAC